MILVMDKKKAAARRRVDNRKMMDSIKMRLGCSLCGYNAHPRALQFDHIDPDTKYRTKSGKLVHPSDMVGLSQSAILDEIAKCQVLCSNCHAIRSHEESHFLSRKM
jgi:hypothetical protein